MDLRVICSFNFFNIEAPFKVGPVIISHHSEELKEECSSDVFRMMLGELKVDKLLTATCIGQAALDLRDQLNTNASSQEKVDLFKKNANAITDLLNGFFCYLWFVKDCSSSVNEIIFYSHDLRYIQTTGQLDRFSNISGGVSFNMFTLDDLINVDIIGKKFTKLLGENAKHRDTDFQVNNGIMPTKLNTRPYNEKSRIERAFTFLQFARQADFVAMKIALYIPIFESLFSSDSSEISHKVAERCAYYLGGTKNEKRTNYDILKDAYDVRSKLLHGAGLTEHKSNPEKNRNIINTQIKICSDIDSLTRVVLTKVIMEDSEIFLSKDMNTFYRDLIFN